MDECEKVKEGELEKDFAKEKADEDEQFTNILILLTVLLLVMLFVTRFGSS